MSASLQFTSLCAASLQCASASAMSAFLQSASRPKGSSIFRVYVYNSSSELNISCTMFATAKSLKDREALVREFLANREVWKQRKVAHRIARQHQGEFFERASTPILAGTRKTATDAAERASQELDRLERLSRYKRETIARFGNCRRSRTQSKIPKKSSPPAALTNCV